MFFKYQILFKLRVFIFFNETNQFSRYAFSVSNCIDYTMGCTMLFSTLESLFVSLLLFFLFFFVLFFLLVFFSTFISLLCLFGVLCRFHVHILVVGSPNRLSWITNQYNQLISVSDLSEPLKNDH